VELGACRALELLLELLLVLPVDAVELIGAAALVVFAAALVVFAAAVRVAVVVAVLVAAGVAADAWLW
jgi:hypothetical protein